MRICIALFMLLSFASIACAESKTPVTIVINSKEIEKPDQRVADMYKQIADSDKQIDVYAAAINAKNAEIASLKNELARLGNVIAVKNGAIDKAMAAIQALNARNSFEGGEMYTDSHLGDVLVKQGLVELQVIVDSKAEQQADMRFTGAIREKRRLVEDKVVYLLSASKLTLNKK